MHDHPIPRDESDDRLELLRLLLADRDWDCAPCARRQLADMLADPPVVREATWDMLADEIAAYLAFRRDRATTCTCPGPGARSRSSWESPPLVPATHAP